MENITKGAVVLKAAPTAADMGLIWDGMMKSMTAPCLLSQLVCRAWA